MEEMHETDEEGRTTLAIAIVADAPVELLKSMVELGKQDTKRRKITRVCHKGGLYPLTLAAIHRTDAASFKLLTHENPGVLRNALDAALKYNKKSTARGTRRSTRCTSLPSTPVTLPLSSL